MDFDNPKAITDEIRLGPLYKTDRNLFFLRVLHVPAGQEELRLFLGMPFEVRAPDGSVVIQAAGDQIGEQVIPVEGRNGAWRVLGTQSGIVRVLNVEPLFSRSPKWLVRGAEVVAEP